MRGIQIFIALIGICLARLASPAREVYRFDPAKSLIQIHLDTAGALGFVGHAHLIQTPLQQGTLVYYAQDVGGSSVELAVNAKALKVIDPKVSGKDRAKIQATMESDRVLDVQRYPQITFKSLRIEPMGTNHLRVTGNLTIRGQTHTVVVEARLEQTGTLLKVEGQSRFKQTTFGIQPVTAGLGTVRVRDEMTISFQVFAAR